MKKFLKKILFKVLFLLVEIYGIIKKINLRDSYLDRYDDEVIDYRTIIINKEKNIDKGYIPKSLIKAKIKFDHDALLEEKYLDRYAAKAVEALFKAAEKEGIILMGKSGYRSGELQKAIYKIYAFLYGKEYVEKYVAVPGGSEHQTGFALDIGNKSNSFISSNEAEWLAENAYKYGFIIRYPKGKEKITGVNYEPWHIRYVGEEIAKKIYRSGITLEEYLFCPAI